MRLHLLRETSCLAIHYDAGNDWLFLDWHGELTIPHLQEACVALARCFLLRPYPRILNSNVQLTGVSWNAASWLVTEFLPHMTLAGIEHVAWVCAPSLRGRNMVQTVISWLPGPQLNLFDDTEAAVHWLQHSRPAHAPGHILPQRPATTQAALAQVVQELQQRVEAQPRKFLRAYPRAA